MKIFKKITALMLCAIMVLGSAAIGGKGFADILDAFSFKASATSSGTCGDNLTWKLSDDGVLTISGTGDMSNYNRSSDVPWYSFRSSIKTVVIENGVTSIGSSAFFGYTGLTDVTISNSVTSIGRSAFGNCTGLTSIDIPDSVISIGYDVFWGCTGLTNVTIPDRVTNIDEYTFCMCTGLTSVTIGNSVASIGNLAFYHCTSLTSIKIPNGVTSIGEGAFEQCSGLTNINIPDSVTNIGLGAFFNCRSLTSVTIPDSVTSIGSWAFHRVENICYSKNMDATGSPWSAERVNYYYDGECLYPDESRTELIVCNRGISGELSIPDSVTTIDSNAFSGCYKVKNLKVPASVENIGADAFKDVCNVHYRGNVEGAPWGAKVLNGFIEKRDGYFMVYDSRAKKVLYGCSTDASGTVEIPDSVEVIESEAFRGCSEVTGIVIKMDDGIEPVIKENAFMGCSKFESIEYKSDNEVITEHQVVFGDNGTRIVFVNKNYSGENKDGKYEIPDGVKVIDDNAFYNCKNLTEITVPDSVVSVGSHAFTHLPRTTA